MGQKELEAIAAIVLVINFTILLSLKLVAPAASEGTFTFLSMIVATNISALVFLTLLSLMLDVSGGN